MYKIFSNFHKFDSKSYWQLRYQTEPDSGTGSYGQPAAWKDQELNLFTSAY